MASLKINVVWSTILTTANYIFPLITYPYVSRVLGVSNIGICNFVDSVINYYCIFAMMGLSYIGIREVAAANKDKNNLSQVFSSLLTLNVITTTIILVVLLTSIFLVPKFYEHRYLMFIGCFKLVFNSLLLEWLYNGLEKFKYITIRSLIVRAVYVVSVFIFVHDADDYPIYFLLVSLTIIINAIVNSVHSRLYVKFTFKGLSLKPYIKPFLILGIYQVLTSFYKTFNVVFLGFVGGETQVGYYTTATKLHGIILAVFTAFTSVMMPRMSSLVAERNKESFFDLFHKSINILFAFSIPLIIFSIIFSDQIIYWISGPGYELAIPCMRIVIPLVFIIGYEQILVFQLLMPLHKDNYVFINSIYGAVVGVILNFLLVPCMYGIGSSLVWLISEIVVLMCAQYFVRRELGLTFPFRKLLNYLLFSIPITICLIAIHKWNPLGDLTLILAIIISFLYFLILEIFILKNTIVKASFRTLLDRISINK